MARYIQGGIHRASLSFMPKRPHERLRHQLSRYSQSTLTAPGTSTKALSQSRYKSIEPPRLSSPPSIEHRRDAPRKYTRFLLPIPDGTTQRRNDDTRTPFLLMTSEKPVQSMGEAIRAQIGELSVVMRTTNRTQGTRNSSPGSYASRETVWTGRDSPCTNSLSMARATSG